MVPQEIPPGTLLASRWIVGGLLGKSPLASVYEAEESRQSRFAALKVFDAVLAEEPGWNDHVKLTQALAELPGDGIARAYDIGIDPALHRPYVASERLVFPTLARSIAERGPFRPAAFVESLGTLAGALDSAHALGIVHGNLKPQNVFVSTDNPRWARITDFCVGRLRAANGVGPAAMLGWSAPEAAAGFATPASDRYALALLTFFSIVGSPWHSVFRGGGSTPDSARPSRVASERAKALGGNLDPAVDAWFARALAADPDARFSSAKEMVRAFSEALFSGPTVEVEAHPEPSSLVDLPPSVAAASTDPALPGDARMPPVSLPTAGPAYASTLEMDKPDSRLFAPGAAVPAPPSTPSLTTPAERQPIPMPLVAVVAVIAIAGVVIGLWLWLG